MFSHIQVNKIEKQNKEKNLETKKIAQWIVCGSNITQLKDTIQPGTMAHACNASTLGGQGRWIT